jgi:hemin uptake protein HemP
MPGTPTDRRDARPEGSPGIGADPVRAERVISTRELLAGAHRVWIEHAAQRYLLQVTRSGKLILTK